MEYVAVFLLGVCLGMGTTLLILKKRNEKVLPVSKIKPVQGGDLETRFMKWLPDNGVKSPTSAYAYCRSIKEIIAKEGLTSWKSLADDIATITPKYCKGGVQEKFGYKDAGTPRAAIKKFQDFINRTYGH